MRAYTSEQGDLAVLRLPPGTDLLGGLTDAAGELGVEAAWVNVMGALRSLTYGYYDQGALEYRTMEHRGEVELASAMGNISLKAGTPFAHLHVVVTDTDGRAFGGHLFEGSEVFVAEIAFHRLAGEAVVREPDPATGLDLWPVE